MPDSNSTSSSSATPWQAQSSARITRPTPGGLVELITYGDDGHFYRRFVATPGHFAPQLVQTLDAAQLQTLLAQLQAQTQALPAERLATEEISNLTQFMHHVEGALRK